MLDKRKPRAVVSGPIEKPAEMALQKQPSRDTPVWSSRRQEVLAQMRKAARAYQQSSVSSQTLAGTSGVRAVNPPRVESAGSRRTPEQNAETMETKTAVQTRPGAAESASLEKSAAAGDQSKLGVAGPAVPVQETRRCLQVVKEQPLVLRATDLASEKHPSHREEVCRGSADCGQVTMSPNISEDLASTGRNARAESVNRQLTAPSRAMQPTRRENRAAISFLMKVGSLVLGSMTTLGILWLLDTGASAPRSGDAAALVSEETAVPAQVAESVLASVEKPKINESPPPRTVLEPKKAVAETAKLPREPEKKDPVQQGITSKAEYVAGAGEAALSSGPTNSADLKGERLRNMYHKRMEAMRYLGS